MEPTIAPESASSNSLFDPSHPLAKGGRKLFIAVTLLLGVIFYYIARYSSGKQIVAAFVIVRQHPFFFIGMLAAESLYLFFEGNFFQRIYKVIGLERGLKYLIALYIGMNLVNTVTPVAGLSGSIYMAYLEHQNGMNHSRSAIINFLY